MARTTDWHPIAEGEEWVRLLDGVLVATIPGPDGVPSEDDAADVSFVGYGEVAERFVRDVNAALGTSYTAGDFSSGVWLPARVEG